MMRKILTAAGAAFAFVLSGAAAEEDPHRWLEEVEGEEALDWVRAENARSLAVLEATPHFEALKQDALAVLTSTDRLALGSIHNGMVYNFWQGGEHVRGLWRRASVESYRAGEPSWETLIDYDAFAAQEGRNWIAGSRVCLSPEYRHCMIQISDGGTDAAYWREYDTETRAFVEDGFSLPEAKSRVSWIDPDTLFVATDTGEGSLTTSGYAKTTRIWRRGEDVAEAAVFFDGATDNVATWPNAQQDGDAVHLFALQAVSSFETVFHYAKGVDGEQRMLPLPKNANLSGVLDGQAIFRLREDWRHGESSYAQGAVVAYDLASDEVTLVFAPKDNQAVQSVNTGKTGLVVTYLEDVSGKAARFTMNRRGAWTAKEIKLPANGVVKAASVGGGTDDAMLTYESMTTPNTLLYVSAGNKVSTIAQTPAFYDASDIVVEQRFATSADGTKVPFFIMARKDVLEAGNAPTVQYGYGGFLSAVLPVYYEDPSRPQHGALAGRLWVSRGGMLVLSNIRGGSEYGSRWHQVALKENRQRAYDDFAAISEQLIESGVTSPEKLGAIGRSNGGLLMGVMMVQRPELYSAIVNGVPLFDMKRYNKLLAGASWMGEYGNPDIPEEWSYISEYSPYQNMKAGEPYPEVFFYTSTKDDRVHPGHARKAAARMKELGYDFYYYENIEGGHGGTANQDQLAHRIALEYAYFAHMLMGGAEGSRGE